MPAFWFYRLADGRFTGDGYIGTDVAPNTPEGCAAALDVTDWQSQRVDLQTRQVVDWQPPAPADDALRSWAWDADVRRWVATPTLAALRAEAIGPVQAEIDSEERRQDRPLRELMQALLIAAQPPQASAAKLAEVAARIDYLRGIRSAMESAATAAELAAITWA